MYIQKAEIKNIRSITDFEIEFKNPAGWHVLIGDNGAGKSTIIRSIALALVGEVKHKDFVQIGMIGLVKIHKWRTNKVRF